MAVQGPGVPRNCLHCNKHFVTDRGNQFYCSKPCRLRAKALRKNERASLPAGPVSGVNLNATIGEMQLSRDRMAQRRLIVDPYLTARAELLEAEHQCKNWSQRLVDRKAKLATLPEPRLSRRVVWLVERKSVRAPAGAVAIGSASTEGALGVIVFGCSEESESTPDRN